MAIPVCLDLWPIRFGKEFITSGTLSKYFAGKVSRAEANRMLRFFITDPETIYTLQYDEYDWDDPISERREAVAPHIMKMIDGLNSKLDEVDSLSADINKVLTEEGHKLGLEERARLKQLAAQTKTFRREISSPAELYEQAPTWKRYFGDKSALLAAQILYAFHRERRRLKKSDGIDFVHAMYLPHTDLWRGDKAFSDLLIKHKVSFSDRVVPTLAELPDRIESAMRARKRDAN